MDERRVFRQHWLVALVLPGLPWLVLLAAVGAGTFHLAGRRGAHLLLIPATAAALKCMWLCLQWLAQTVTPEEEASQLVIRGGVLHVHEERIPLNRVTGISYEKPWWATLLRLNAATVVVEVFGRTRTLPYIHRYQELWQALQGTGQTGVVWVRRTQAQ